MPLSQDTFSAAGGAVSDIFSAFGDMSKASMDRMEAESYDAAARLAGENEKYTETSTAIKQMQQQRELGLTIGKQEAGVAGAGFAESGSALDLLRESASQGALTKSVIGQQGLITEEGYKEQQASYELQSQAASEAADAAGVAGIGAGIGAVLKTAAAVASIAAAPVTGGASLAGLSLTATGGLY